IPSVAMSGSPAGPAATGPRPVSPSAVPAPTGPTPIPSFVRPTPTPLPTFFAYIVKSGDNLNTIAHRFGTTGRSIAYWNRGTYPSLDPEAPGYQPNLVRVGWTLVLIPNTVVDEQTLPEPTPGPTDPFEEEPSPS
ncbi:MAG TPA: LysM peptidoglycan-binding domain-containing protein, partial [Candidatus Limnocylindrales bacterium]|nr:LysM peptidoglycan-binding domain-containing protein [Candidatus Limnocylindrales bacterium]